MPSNPAPNSILFASLIGAGGAPEATSVTPTFLLMSVLVSSVLSAGVASLVMRKWYDPHRSGYLPIRT